MQTYIKKPDSGCYAFCFVWSFPDQDRVQTRREGSDADDADGGEQCGVRQVGGILVVVVFRFVVRVGGREAEGAQKGKDLRLRVHAD